MSDLLASLAAFAVSNNNTRGAGATPIHQLSVEDARGRLIIRDGNKEPKEGVQALVIGCGRRVLTLDVIKKNSTRLNVPNDQVEAVTAQLQTAIDAGSFDEAIGVALAALKATAEKTPVAKPSVAEQEAASEEVEDTSEEDVDGLDLDSI